MRYRLVLLVAATTSLVVVAFLVPLAILVRSAAADRAVSAAIIELDALVPLVTTADTASLADALDRANAGRAHPVTVFLPGGRAVGAPTSPRPAAASPPAPRTGGRSCSPSGDWPRAPP
jgi:hypothetical protein